MSISKEAINFFEILATNAHHHVNLDQLLSDQSPEVKDIYLSNNSQYLKNRVSGSEYLADSIKVTEV